MVDPSGARPCDRRRRHAGAGDSDRPLRVWGYALAWFSVTDPLKLLAYRYLDATKKTVQNGLGAAEAKITDKAGTIATPALPRNPTPRAAE